MAGRSAAVSVMVFVKRIVSPLTAVLIAARNDASSPTAQMPLGHCAKAVVGARRTAAASTEPYATHLNEEEMNARMAGKRCAHSSPQTTAGAGYWKPHAPVHRGDAERQSAVAVSIAWFARRSACAFFARPTCSKVTR